MCLLGDPMVQSLEAFENLCLRRILRRQVVCFVDPISTHRHSRTMNNWFEDVHVSLVARVSFGVLGASSPLWQSEILR